MSPPTYKSTALRARDAHAHNTYSSEINALKQSYHRTTDDLRERLFEIENKANRFCKILGFESIEEGILCAQREGTTYRELVECGRKGNEEAGRVELLREDVARIKERHQSTQNTLTALQSAHTSLLTRFQDLLTVKQRCDERYRKDYARYKAFKEWLFNDTQQKVQGSDMKKVRTEKRRERFLQDMGEGDIKSPYDDDVFLDSIGPNAKEMVNIRLGDEKENAPKPSTSRHTEHTPISSPPSQSRVLSPTSPQKHRVLVPNSSPTSSYGDGKDPSPFKVPSLPLGRSRSPSKTRTVSYPGASQSRSNAGFSSSPANSSPGKMGEETEEETQTAFVFPRVYSPSSKTPRNAMGLLERTVGKNGATPGTPTPTLVQKPSQVESSPRSSIFPPRPNKQKQQQQGDQERPNKRSRLSFDHLDNVKQESSDGEVVFSTSPPRPSFHQKRERERVNSTPSSSKQRVKDQTGNGKGKGRKSYEGVDYSSYKGRGRYGKKNGDADQSTTINSKYKINTSTNNGLEYAYDEVVRKRDERKRLTGGDCEQCRDYYEAIGPLPPRLQAPLWRSPSPSRSHHHHHHHNHDNDKEEHEIDREEQQQAHKTAISRHRHQWARAKTPPGYWDIGFPDTQRVEGINEEAKRMQQGQLKDVEKQVGGNGRWVKR